MLNIIVYTIIVVTIKTQFINRKSELEYIENEYSKHDFRFISIIGRRRLGKTRFIQQFLETRHDHCYLLVPELNDPDVRLEVARSFHEHFGLSFMGTPSWDEIFEKLFQYSQDNRIVVVFDEFQRFSNINSSIYSYLQKHIDKYATSSKMFLVVSGSSIGMMHKIFDHASPLYGRRTGQLDLEPFRFFALNDWFPNFSLESRVHTYAVYGGTPKYLEDVEHEDIMDNVNRLLTRTSVLYNEPENLLKTKISDSNTYFNILKDISRGVSRPSEIATSSGIKPTSIDYFLNVLIRDMDLIKKEIPVTDKKSSKKGIYLVKDDFFRFWFRFVYPNYSELEIGNTQHVLEKIGSELNTFTGHAFEEITKQFLVELNTKGRLPFTFGKIGRQWGKFRGEKGKNTYEIDLVAINENTHEILFCECKWQIQKTDIGVLEDLVDRSGFVDWHNKNRTEYFTVVSRSGFTENARNYAKRHGFLLFTLQDLDTIAV